MPPRTAKARLLLACSILAALGVVFFAVLVATLGGFLNHCRGGYIHIGPSDAKPGSHVYEEWYWPQHILARLLFALPTGLLVVSCLQLSIVTTKKFNFKRLENDCVSVHRNLQLSSNIYSLDLPRFNLTYR